MWGKTGTYSFFDHAADVGIRLHAPSVEELFAAAGCALMEWIGPPPPGPARHDIAIEVTADNRPELLVQWLNELLYCFHEQHSYFLGADSIQIRAAGLSARAVMVDWNEEWQHNFQEVKAVTYHRLQLVEEEGEWKASVILDI